MIVHVRRARQLVALCLTVVLFAAAARAFGAQGRAPAPENAPPDVRLDAAARRGLDLLTRTRLRLPVYAGNRLNCTSCHIDGGRRPGALPWTDVARTYPQYRAREGRVVTLEDRVDQCFLRSLNGKAPPHDSPVIRDILAYFAWLSKSAPAEARTKAPGIAAQFVAGPPDARAGEVLYRSRCVRCHASDGSGLSDPDDDPYVDVPPLWGKESFNIGAGMARLHTAERFIQRTMPQGAEGTLPDQQARDVASFVIRQPRPDFAEKTRDWPKGGKPDDARY